MDLLVSVDQGLRPVWIWAEAPSGTADLRRTAVWCTTPCGGDSGKMPSQVRRGILFLVLIRCRSCARAVVATPNPET